MNKKIKYCPYCACELNFGQTGIEALGLGVQASCFGCDVHGRGSSQNEAAFRLITHFEPKRCHVCGSSLLDDNSCRPCRDRDQSHCELCNDPMSAMAIDDPKTGEKEWFYLCIPCENELGEKLSDKYLK